MARGGATHIFVDFKFVKLSYVLPTFWDRRPWRYGFRCGLVHTQLRRCRDFAMWTLSGGAFGCHVCPLLLSYDAPVAPLVVTCVFPLRLSGDLVFDFLCSCRVCLSRLRRGRGATPRTAPAENLDR